MGTGANCGNTASQIPFNIIYIMRTNIDFAFQAASPKSNPDSHFRESRQAQQDKYQIKTNTH